MDINEYQEKAHSFATNGGDTLIYSLLGAIEEIGEICEKTNIDESTEWSANVAGKVKQFVKLSKEIGGYAKRIRKEWNQFSDDDRKSLVNIETVEGIDKEVGDVMWMLANVAYHIGFKMDDVIEQNIVKLEDRLKRNVIIGSGDNR